jgi:acyl-ACP thioesterase
MFLTALIIFSLVVFIWYIWAYTIFRYQSDRVNSKILKRYKIANPDSYKPETEDIKTNDHVYNSDYTQLTANVIIFDKRTRDTIKEQPIKLKISSTCSPILSTCIKL